MSNLQQLKLASIVQKQVLKLSKKATTFSSGRLLSRTFSFSQNFLMENRDAAQVVGPFKLEGQVTKGKIQFFMQVKRGLLLKSSTK